MNLGEITRSMEKLTDWSLQYDTINKNFEFKDFKEAIEFVNKVGEIAEKNEHHPDITISYNKVALSLTTHSEKRLTEKDFNVAEEIDRLNPG